MQFILCLIDLYLILFFFFCCDSVLCAVWYSAFGIPAKKDTHKTGAGGETIVKDKSQSTWLKLSETFVCGFAAGGRSENPLVSFSLQNSTINTFLTIHSGPRKNKGNANWKGI